MAVHVDKSETPAVNSRQSHILPEIPRIDLRAPGRLRADDVQALLRVSRAWLWKQIKNGVYPAPDYYEGKIPFWKNATLLKFFEGDG